MKNFLTPSDKSGKTTTNSQIGKFSGVGANCVSRVPTPIKNYRGPTSSPCVQISIFVNYFYLFKIFFNPKILPRVHKK
jgi:hypothetical protein